MYYLLHLQQCRNKDPTETPGCHVQERRIGCMFTEWFSANMLRWGWVGKRESKEMEWRNLEHWKWEQGIELPIRRTRKQGRGSEMSCPRGWPPPPHYYQGTVGMAQSCGENRGPQTPCVKMEAYMGNLVPTKVKLREFITSKPLLYKVLKALI